MSEYNLSLMELVEGEEYELFKFVNSRYMIKSKKLYTRHASDKKEDYILSDCFDFMPNEKQFKRIPKKVEVVRYVNPEAISALSNEKGWDCTTTLFANADMARNKITITFER